MPEEPAVGNEKPQLKMANVGSLCLSCFYQNQMNI